MTTEDIERIHRTAVMLQKTIRMFMPNGQGQTPDITLALAREYSLRQVQIIIDLTKGDARGTAA